VVNRAGAARLRGLHDNVLCRGGDIRNRDGIEQHGCKKASKAKTQNTNGANMSVKISCCCPTHGRAHVIGEAIESYLRQEPCGVETELVVLNDCEEQPLVCEAPGVRIFNVDQMTGVCEKFDVVVNLARGEYIAWWEDDDISLPHRLKRSVEMLKDGAAYKQKNAWYMQNGHLVKHAENLFFGNSIFKKSLYMSGGGAGDSGYPDVNAHMGMMSEIARTGGWYEMELAQPRDIFFIYRWGGEVTHDSGFGATMNDNVARMKAFRERTLAHPDFRAGRQIIEPAWKKDYVKEVERFVS